MSYIICFITSSLCHHLFHINSIHIFIYLASNICPNGYQPRMCISCQYNVVPRGGATCNPGSVMAQPLRGVNFNSLGAGNIFPVRLAEPVFNFPPISVNRLHIRTKYLSASPISTSHHGNIKGFGAAKGQDQLYVLRYFNYYYKDI